MYTHVHTIEIDQTHQESLQVNFMGGGAIFLMEVNTSEFETCQNSVKIAYLWYYVYCTQVIQNDSLFNIFKCNKK